jgi:peptidoglycan/LPS O-acetylase OafA/YrhL
VLGEISYPLYLIHPLATIIIIIIIITGKWGEYIAIAAVLFRRGSSPVPLTDRLIAIGSIALVGNR